MRAIRTFSIVPPKCCRRNAPQRSEKEFKANLVWCSYFISLLHLLPAYSPDVALYDYIKDEVGFRLADRLFDVKREFAVAVDLGCNRGFVSKHIMADVVKRLHLCDISPTMLAQADGTPGLQIERHVMDEERLRFEADSVDLVVSSLSLHWVNDLPGCFAQIKRCLRPDGVFIGALYGGETLFELRSALQLAEVERKGGIGPHISPFTQVKYIWMVQLIIIDELSSTPSDSRHWRSAQSCRLHNADD